MFPLINNAENNIMTNLHRYIKNLCSIKTCEIFLDEHQQNLKSISNGAKTRASRPDPALLSLGLVLAKIIIFQGWMGFQR